MYGKINSEFLVFLRISSVFCISDDTDGVIADLEAAVLIVHCFDFRDLVRRRGFEIAFDVGVKGWLVVLDGEQVIGPGIEDRLGDGGIAPMASIETRAPSRSSRSTSAGMAVISFDFSNTASWPSIRRLLVAKADTRWSALWPVLRLWLRREVLPSIATRPSLSGQHCATHDVKQSLNRFGSMRFMTQRSAQEGQVRLAPIDDIFVIVAARDRPAHYQEQHLAQRVNDLPGLQGILDLRKVIERRRNRGLADTAPTSIGPSRIGRVAENHSRSAAGGIRFAVKKKNALNLSSAP
jgi:hypothetical protein